MLELSKAGNGESRVAAALLQQSSPGAQGGAHPKEHHPCRDGGPRAPAAQPRGPAAPFTTQLRAAEPRVLSAAGTLAALGASRAELSTRHGGNGRPHPAEVVLRNRQVASLHPAALQQQRPVTGRGSCSTGQPPAAARRDARSATAPLLQPPPDTGRQGPCSQVTPCRVRPADPHRALCGVLLPLLVARPGRHRSAPSPLLGCRGSAPSSPPGGGILAQTRQGHVNTDALVQLRGS